MQSFSVVIVGAGPGGLACARLLAEHGLDVLVLERKSVVGPKVCGGGITWDGLLKRVPGDLIDGSFPAQHIRSNYQQTIIRSSDPIVATVRREVLGEWMCRQAENAGAVIKTSCLVNRIDHDSVSTNLGDFRYRYLVGADGSGSIVRKHLRLGTEKVGVGIHFQVPGNFENMEWHLNHNRFNNGYGWIFPYRDMASVGIYGAKPYNNPGKMLASLLQWTKQRKIPTAGMKPRAGLINFDYRGWHFGNKMLIGDAAGLASGLTGEGMYSALVSGETAAGIILDPEFDCRELQRLIKKQQKHRKIVEISAKNKLINIGLMEILILALRIGLIPFSMLEMAD
ncbi:MAG: NAD(P)/FAD-dependent oxidoreductase [Deltaproteobacteria bacterium]|jgi:geranylgeranyl reductase|nr:NAD(P)/FAD-dependent oxidoreductase [Deltaproteobacteria bacterium]